MDAAGLPNTFVPGRNLLFFQLAAAVGYRRGLHTLVGGMCETDFSGYPDCRDDTLKALQVAVSLGMGQRFTFETPLMWLDKAQTWALAHHPGRRRAGGHCAGAFPHLLPRASAIPAPRLGLRLRRPARPAPCARPGLSAGMPSQALIKEAGWGGCNRRITPCIFCMF
jgi:hypothetical protein